MIKPTVGRVVWYYPAPGDSLVHSLGQPLAAHVANIHSDRLVNLMVIDAMGIPHARPSVVLIQDGDPMPNGPYCVWMPYQKGQAAKTEALETKLKA